MVFLIRFDPPNQKLVLFECFEDGQLAEAQKERLRLELDLLAQGIRDEVVILEAAGEDVIRRTHRRYFETLEQILRKAS